MAHSAPTAVAVACRRPNPRTSVRRKLALFAPFALLVLLGIAANAGGHIASNADAATVNVTATVASDKHLAASICTGGSTGETAGAAGTMNFGAMSPNTAYIRNCTIPFGSANSATVNMQVNAASSTFGWTGFAVQGACSTPAAATAKVGIDASSALGATTVPGGPIDCATAGMYQTLPTAATTACTVTGQTTDGTCILSLSVTTGAAAGGSVSNSSMTVNAA